MNSRLLLLGIVCIGFIHSVNSAEFGGGDLVHKKCLERQIVIWGSGHVFLMDKMYGPTRPKIDYGSFKISPQTLRREGFFRPGFKPTCPKDKIPMRDYIMRDGPCCINGHSFGTEKINIDDFLKIIRPDPDKSKERIFSFSKSPNVGLRRLSTSPLPIFFQKYRNEVLDVLNRLASDSDSIVRAFTLDAARRCGTDVAVPIAERLKSDQSPAVRDAVAAILKAK